MERLTRDQKARLAGVLIAHSATLVEFWTEQAASAWTSDCSDITTEQAAEQIAQWLKGLPGNAWDSRLPNPNRKEPT